MPETINSGLFCLFMVQCLLFWVTSKPVHSRLKDDSLPPMPSLSEALHEFSAIVLTGGSSGIGKSFIELTWKLHPKAVICNLSRHKPEGLVGDVTVHHFPCDLSQQQALSAVVPGVLGLLSREAPSGRVLLVNNSGFGGYGRFPEPGVGHHTEMIDVNVRAVVELTGRMLPLLRARGGCILTVSSLAAFQPTPWTATYGATKAFLLNWSLALNEELRGTGVRALAVCPGPTGTNFFRRAGLRQGSVGSSLSQSADRVTLEAVRALARGRSVAVTGWTNRIGAAVAGMLPRVLAARLARIILGRYRLKHVR